MAPFQHTLIIISAYICFMGFIIPINSAKILGLFPHSSESHFAVMKTIFRELAKREHNVTIYSSHRLNERIENLQEFVIEPEFKFWQEVKKTAKIDESFGNLNMIPDTTLEESIADIGEAAIDYFLSNNQLKKLLEYAPREFDYDLIIIDLFYTESLLALGHIHKKPTIAIINTDIGGYMNNVLTNILPIECSYFDLNSNSSNSIGYWARLTKVHECMTMRKTFEHMYLKKQEQTMKKHFSHLTDSLPTVAKLQANVDLLLLNTYVPLLTPRALIFNTIPVGGLHIGPPRDIAWNLKNFLDEARFGVIYMNFGNEQLCGDIPRRILNIVFSAFEKRKEKCLWTCHDSREIDGMPENFLIQHTVPQSDILAHPHIKAFIMNGDLLALQEGIIRHVPMIGIPLFKNEIKNVDLAVDFGIGVKISYSNISEDSLIWALECVSSNRDLALKIRKISTHFRDRPLGGLETTIYWVNYLLRYGNKQIRFDGFTENYIQLDLVVFILCYFLMGIIVFPIFAYVSYLTIKVWKRKRNIKENLKRN